MSKPCKDCKQSIFNNQDSSIPEPLCQGDCPEDVNCNGEVTYSDCVSVNAALDCFDTEVGDSLTSVLQAANEKCKQGGSSSNCKVKVSSDDTCCGYLDTKITSSDLDISIPDGTSCKALVISEKCRTWTDVRPTDGLPGSFIGNWGNFTPFSAQVAGYSLKNCEVKLRGTVFINNYNPGANIIYVLPVGSRPQYLRVFSVNLANSLNGQPMESGFIYIAPSGEVALTYTQLSSGTTVVSFDGLSFETN